MVALRSGQRPALDVLIRRYERELFLYLKRYLRDATLADDVFQNSFMQVYLKRSTFDPSRRFKPWLYAIATNQAVDALRRHHRPGNRTIDDGDDPDVWTPASSGISPLEGAMQGELRERVVVAIDGLPAHLRQVILLTYFQGLKYRDVAEVLDIPVGTVKSRLFAAIQAFQERWLGLFPQEAQHGT